MAKSTYHKCSFNSGEISRKAYGRYDIDKYANAVGLLENFLIYQLGGIMYRPGSIMMAEVKDSDYPTNLIPFQYSTAQAYAIELGDAYMRFFANTGDVVGGTSFVDSETTPKAVTPNGDVLITTIQYKFGSSCALFDGAGDYLTLADNADWEFGTGNFTIDFWVRFAAVPTGTNINFCSQYQDSTTFWRVAYINNALEISFVKTSAYTGLYYTAPIVFAANTWYHLAFVRNGTTGLIFINGVPQALTENTAFGSGDVGIATSLLNIGSSQGLENFLNGWMDEFRLSKGIARWTADFSASLPSSPYSPDSYTKLLLHFEETTLEISSPFAQADLFNIHYTQNADVMYLTNQKYAPQKLVRLSSSSFSISAVNFVRGPFLDTNVGNVQIAGNPATATTTLTATVPAWNTGINYIVDDFVTQGGVHYRCIIAHIAGTFADDLTSNYWVQEDFFKNTGNYGAKAGHVGSLWKVHNAVVKITGYSSKTVVTGVVQAEPDGSGGVIGTAATPYTDWAEGAFSDYRGYPATCGFHQQRLFYANTPHQPQTFFGSVVGAYDDFNSGTAGDDDAVQFEFASDQPNPIRWIKSNYDKLTMGTSSGTVSVSGSSSSLITPADIDVKFDTDWGTATTPAKRISSLVLYLQSNNFQLREVVYDWATNRYFARDMNLLAEHILRDGAGAIAFDKQQSPNARFWVIRDDGQLAVLTRNPEQDVMGWTRIIAGSDAKGVGLFEAITILQRDGYDDRIWVIVKRNINNTVKRFVEYFSYENFVNAWEPVLLDCSLTYDNPKTITAISKASSQVTITSVLHGFSNSDEVKIDLVVGMTQLNGNVYVVSDVATDTFKLKDSSGTYIDSTAFGTYLSGGEVRKLVTSVSGLNHLNGETVSVQIDGGLPSTETYTVTANAITLSEKAAVVTVGLPYTARCRLLKLSDGSPTGGQTKSRRFYLSTLRVVDSLTFQIGQDEDNLTPVYIRPTTMTKGQSPVLLNGDIEQYFTSWWSKEGEAFIKHTKPLPLFITAIIMRSEVEEK